MARFTEKAMRRWEGFNGVKIVDEPDLENVRRLDHAPMRMVYEMYRAGICVDRDVLADLSVRLTKEMKERREEIEDLVGREGLGRLVGKWGEGEDDADAGEGNEKREDNVEVKEVARFNPNSAVQKTKLLFDVMGLEGKVKAGSLRYTKGGDRLSSDKKQLEILCRVLKEGSRERRIVEALKEYTERHKLKTTYADALPGLAKKHSRGTCWCGRRHYAAHWRIHASVGTTRASTGRLNCTNPNLQNIPIRTALGRMIRAAFIPQPGYRLVNADYSQVELRTLAHAAREPEMIRVYKEGLDIHVHTACLIFNRPPEQIDSMLHRLPSKTVNFGVVYGMTDLGLQASLMLNGVYWTQEECQGFIVRWFDAYDCVEPYMLWQHSNARRYGFVWDMWGGVRWIPEVYSVHRRVVQAGLRQAGNMPIQGGATAFTKLAMGSIQDRGDWQDNAVPLMVIHDELLAEAEEDKADKMLGVMLAEMNGVCPVLRVEIKADGGTLERWEKK